MRLILITSVFTLMISYSIPVLCNDYLTISDVLFPETTGWTQVNNTDKSNIKNISAISDTLKKTLLNSNLGKYHESEHCPLADILFSKDELKNNFFSVDVDSDGLEDVIYTGASTCNEGNIVIVWFGNTTGYEIRQEYAEPMLVLRIKSGVEPLFSSVEIGCCADPIDVYHIGVLGNFRNKKHMQITSQTLVPTKEQLIAAQSFKARDEIILRSTPENLNDYDSGYSSFMGNAIFGNVLSKYLPDCGGTTTAKMIDSDTITWYFVLLDEACETFRTHSPYEVDSGWVKSTEILFIN